MNKDKESALAFREGDANLLGAKDSISLVGLAGCCKDRNSMPFSKLMLCSQKEPIVCETLNCCPPGVFVKPDCSGSKASSWVLQKLMDVHHYVGLSCDGFEEELMELFIAIEVVTGGEWVSNSK